jgi:hypothetical protein
MDQAEKKSHEALTSEVHPKTDHGAAERKRCSAPWFRSKLYQRGKQVALAGAIWLVTANNA